MSESTEGLSVQIVTDGAIVDIWGPSRATSRKQSSNDLKRVFTSIETAPGSFREEAQSAARELASRTSRPLFVCLSGGILSEMAAEAFYSTRVPFRAAILRFKKDLNFHDIARAIIYCESRGISYDFFELDLDRYLARSFAKVVRQTGCGLEGSPATTFLVDQIDKAGGFAVCGGGLPQIDCVRSKLFVSESNAGFALDRWAKSNQRHCEARFFSSTPLLYASYLSEVAKLSLENLQDGGDFNRSVQTQIMIENFNLQSRRRYDGYEKCDFKVLSSRPKPRTNKKAELITVPLNQVIKTVFGQVDRPAQRPVHGARKKTSRGI